MRELVFATNNKHKQEEVQAMLPQYRILSLSDIGCNADIPETADTLQGNALIKARFVKENYGYDCFADDTGLEVEALDMAPGVYSARYAGEDKSSEANITKLLAELSGKSDRKAQFRTVIALIEGEKESLFEGVVKGEITDKQCGSGGFGYDPVFKPEGFDLTFAEMELAAKNQISHRARAVIQLIHYLNGK
ncbi:MAG: non-canonical purine NTP diphosphatase [Bacteroidales bacterium]